MLLARSADAIARASTCGDPCVLVHMPSQHTSVLAMTKFRWWALRYEHALGAMKSTIGQMSHVSCVVCDADSLQSLSRSHLLVTVVAQTLDRATQPSSPSESAASTPSRRSVRPPTPTCPRCVRRGHLGCCIGTSMYVNVQLPPVAAKYPFRLDKLSYSAVQCALTAAFVCEVPSLNAACLDDVARQYQRTKWWINDSWGKSTLS